MQAERHHARACQQHERQEVQASLHGAEPQVEAQRDGGDEHAGIHLARERQVGAGVEQLRVCLGGGGLRGGQHAPCRAERQREGKGLAEGERGRPDDARGAQQEPPGRLRDAVGCGNPHEQRPQGERALRQAAHERDGRPADPVQGGADAQGGGARQAHARQRQRHADERQGAAPAGERAGVQHARTARGGQQEREVRGQPEGHVHVARLRHHAVEARVENGVPQAELEEAERRRREDGRLSLRAYILKWRLHGCPDFSHTCAKHLQYGAQPGDLPTIPRRGTAGENWRYVPSVPRRRTSLHIPSCP